MKNAIVKFLEKNKENLKIFVSQLTNVIIVQTIQTKQQLCQKYMKAIMK